MGKRGRWDDSDSEQEASASRIERGKESVMEKDTLAMALSNKVIGTTSEAKISIASSNQNMPQIMHGCRSVDEYKRLSFINQGTYGMVFKARCRKTSDLVALKQVKLGPEFQKGGFPITALRETNILLALQHPNIIRIREMVVGSTMDKIYMVMDYYDFDLRKCMEMSKQPFSTAEVKRLIHQLLCAIDHMHDRWYIHRDLKTTNLLYSNSGSLCVCDFGMARKYGSPVKPYTNEVVTLWYRAPELLLGSRVYSTPLDMWSVGCIFAEMLNGKPLFPGQGEIDQMNQIFKCVGMPNDEKWPGFSLFPLASKVSIKASTKGKLRELFPSASFAGGVFLSDTGYDLLSRLLEMDPSKRISASTALVHPWLSSEQPRPAPVHTMPRFELTSSGAAAANGGKADDVEHDDD